MYLLIDIVDLHIESPLDNLDQFYIQNRGYIDWLNRKHRVHNQDLSDIHLPHIDPLRRLLDLYNQHLHCILVLNILRSNIVHREHMWHHLYILEAQNIVLLYILLLRHSPNLVHIRKASKFH
jgi:hypothetical protein